MDTRIREYSCYHPEEVLPLYQSVGWRSYTARPDMLREAYRHSLRAWAAYADNKLIGMVRIVGDGHSVIFVQDLLVHPDYQRQGVGTALLRRVIEAYPHVYQLHLLTDCTEQTARFYQSLGFVMDTACGMRAFSRYNAG